MNMRTRSRPHPCSPGAAPASPATRLPAASAAAGASSAPDPPSTTSAELSMAPRPKRMRRSSHPNLPIESVHPVAKQGLRAIDASTFERDPLLDLLITHGRRFEARLDFVNCSDDMIDWLFVNDRARQRSRAELLYPPKHRPLSLLVTL